MDAIAGTVDYQETTYMLSHPIELLGQPFLRSRSASKSQKAAELQFKYDRLQLIRQVKSLYAEYWQLSEKLEIYNRALDVIRKARSSAKARQAKGTFSGLQASLGVGPHFKDSLYSLLFNLGLFKTTLKSYAKI